MSEKSTKVKRVRKPIQLTYKNLQSKCGNVPKDKYWLVLSVAPMSGSIKKMEILKRRLWEKGKYMLDAYNLIVKSSDSKEELEKYSLKYAKYDKVKVV